MSITIETIFKIMSVLGGILLSALVANVLSASLAKSAAPKVKRLSILKKMARKRNAYDKINIIRTRIFDLVFSIAVFVFLLSWLVPVLGLAIKLTSYGPILTLYKKRTLFNQEILLMNFRTFLFNRERKVIGVSKLGEFLRRTDLNNLPNFYNVLNGDLSIVGTTVLPATLVERNNVYKDEVDLKGIKPGFISLYQVYHPNVVFGGLKVKELNIDDVIGYDLFYINNKSLLLDIKILYRFFIFFIGYATPEKVNLNIDKANTFVDESRVLHHVD